MISGFIVSAYKGMYYNTQSKFSEGTPTPTKIKKRGKTAKSYMLRRPLHEKRDRHKKEDILSIPDISCKTTLAIVRPSRLQSALSTGNFWRRGNLLKILCLRTQSHYERSHIEKQTTPVGPMQPYSR
jgi:hypothetical protein